MAIKNQLQGAPLELIKMENLWLASMVHEMGNKLILEKEKSLQIETKSNAASHSAAG
jgi:hypothetical protein